MSYKVETKSCRICGNTELAPILSLGDQRLSGVFPMPDSPQPSFSPLELIKCDNSQSFQKNCGLLQLKHSASLEEMYGATYGYYSSLSPTMVSHLKDIVDLLVKFVKPESGDIALDIGCNDGTLLNILQDQKMFRVGIDPSSEKFSQNFQKDIKVIYEFFSANKVKEVIGERKCRIITSIAMFYDIDDPIDFMRQIRSVLDKNGVWALELSYLPSMLTNLTYDQICHEHVTYLGLYQMKWMTERTGLKILDLRLNEVNGGSFFLIVGRDDGPFKQNEEKIMKTLQYEKPLCSIQPFMRFKNRVLSHRDEVRAFLKLAKEANKKVYGYGASTKGNIVLNFCNIESDCLTAICDANPEKFGLVTPGTSIPIISKEDMRKANPDYLFILIWHFRREVLQSEYEYIMNGRKMVFDLPRLHIVDKNNHHRYLNTTFEELAYSL